jgi:hypothetical protein
MSDRRVKVCYALGCKAIIPRSILMCRAHWHSVPGPLQACVYETYRAWIAGGSARAYLLASLKAKLAVANAEGVEPALTDSIQAGIDQYEKGGAA